MNSTHRLRRYDLYKKALLRKEKGFSNIEQIFT